MTEKINKSAKKKKKTKSQSRTINRIKDTYVCFIYYMLIEEIQNVFNVQFID